MKTLLFILIPLLSFSQVQIGDNLIGNSDEGRFGASVSISSDGNILAIGEPYGLNENKSEIVGLVQVFENISNNWIQKGSTIFGKDRFSDFGGRISLSSDGNILVIGAIRGEVNGLRTGLVRIYEFKNNNWIQLGQDINGEMHEDFFGRSVDLSSNGNVLAIGSGKHHSSSDAEGTGYVKVYSYDGSNWNLIGSDFKDESSNVVFGNQISLSSDGSVLAIGIINIEDQIFYNTDVLIYKYNGTNWNQLGNTNIQERIPELRFYDLDLSSDGTTLVIGLTYYGTRNGDIGSTKGHAKIYKYSNGEWNQLGSIIDGDDISAKSVSLSSDASIIAIGDPYKKVTGQTMVYSFQNSIQDWNIKGSKLFGDSFDNFGECVALSSDGSTLVVGAPGLYTTSRNRGLVKVYNIQSAALSSEEVNKGNDMVIYPNPIIDILNIDLKKGRALKEVSIYNIQNQFLFSTKQDKIDVSILTSGLYFIQIETNRGKSIKKFIKE
ncbi:T9SS type A sorting domain-containing protein [Jejuia pallidilutea]|uniref:Putative metallopeptidase n=1 Tax=Jejuia pallidilutea TaxID=504487 RepID=A0A090WPV1_9FLAO|nr:T9SS type A sorting domain-containing protein [Jejuia pallidilutea]GAL69447.1 putative metallopeptidase [Jejuia pallidilutea]GAL89052.1 putative metallopeptidase [Jejuia pallidilutea]